MIELKQTVDDLYVYVIFLKIKMAEGRHFEYLAVNPYDATSQRRF